MQKYTEGKIEKNTKNAKNAIHAKTAEKPKIKQNGKECK